MTAQTPATPTFAIIVEQPHGTEVVTFSTRDAAEAWRETYEQATGIFTLGLVPVVSPEVALAFDRFS